MTNTTNLGAQGVSWTVFGAECLQCVFDLRWMIILAVVLIITDYWWGVRELAELRKKATIKGGKRVLMMNGKEVDAVFAGNIDHFGLRVDGNNLKADRVDIATSSVAKPNLVDSNPLMFGDASLGNGVCINITSEDYNKLRSGESVAGYARYNERCIYNIVADVSTAEVISFTEDGNGNVEFDTGVVVERADNMIYNSVTDELVHNVEDTTATMTSDACPFVNVRNIDPIVKRCDYKDLRLINSENGGKLIER